MAGNGVLLKHAANVPGCAEAIADAFDRAGFPEAIFQHLPVSSGKVEAIIAHPRVAAVSLTGSTEAGRSVAGQAGRHLKKTVLELGGSDPYLILEDADLEVAVEACVTSRLLNSGQSCIAAKRFIVVDAVREPFEEKLVAALRAKVMGDPLDENTDIGPQARRRSARQAARPGHGFHPAGSPAPAGRCRSRRPRIFLSAHRADRCRQGNAGL